MNLNWLGDVAMYDNATQEATESLTTSSRVRTWFMVQFKGYTVVEMREVPKVTRLGRLTYDCLWQLRAPGGEKDGVLPSKDGAKS